MVLFFVELLEPFHWSWISAITADITLRQTLVLSVDLICISDFCPLRMHRTTTSKVCKLMASTMVLTTLIEVPIVNSLFSQTFLKTIHIRTTYQVPSATRYFLVCFRLRQAVWCRLTSSCLARPGGEGEVATSKQIEFPAFCHLPSASDKETTHVEPSRDLQHMTNP